MFTSLSDFVLRREPPKLLSLDLVDFLLLRVASMCLRKLSSETALGSGSFWVSMVTKPWWVWLCMGDWWAMGVSL